MGNSWVTGKVSKPGGAEAVLHAQQKSNGSARKRAVLSRANGCGLETLSCALLFIDQTNAGLVGDLVPRVQALAGLLNDGYHQVGDTLMFVK